MEQQSYNCVINVSISATEAIEGIINVSGWWTENLEGATQNPGDVFTVRFGETFVTFKVMEVVPGKKIVWQAIDCYLQWLNDKTEWKGTKIRWDISSENNQTEVSFTHVGLVPAIECYTDCEKGWNFYIKESLFKLLTEHRGMPEKAKPSPVENN